MQITTLLLLTQYSSEASRLIKSFTKNFLFLLLILSVIAIITVLDLSKTLTLIHIFSDTIMDGIIIIVSISHYIQYNYIKAFNTITKNIEKVMKSV
ncbi:MAG: hypothetical protein R3321_11405 [Nitrososphaeraceae archaeon]|nr:hypothetical protein [Nitrososphaeraceae archaeon]